MKFKGKYERLAESTITRYQTQGVLIGDLVKIRPDVLKHEKIKDLGDNFKTVLKQLIDTDLNIRVCAIRNAYADHSAAAGLGISVPTNTAGELWVDVCQEYAPGLFKNPITIPLSSVEVLDTGINGAPIPDSIKYKGKINIKPEEVSYVDNRTEAGSRKLPTKNTTLDYVKGSAKQPVMDSVKRNDQDMLLDAYQKVMDGSRSKIMTVSVANAFGDNVERLLATENIKYFKTRSGQKTNFDVIFKESKQELEKFIRQNAIGDNTFLQIYDNNQQIAES